MARPRAIFGIGLNYAAHVEETGGTLPEAPIVFMKLPTSAAAPNAPISAPAVVRRLDYEGELAVVMGAGGEVAGYAVADDVSARDLQRREPQWTRAKGFDGSCPYGPWITTADEVRRPARPRAAHLGQRRAAPGLAHVGPDLRGARSSSRSCARRSRSSPAT